MWTILAGMLTLPSIAHADDVQALVRGDESLSAFYTSISHAKTSIDLASFLFEPCESAPKILLDAIVKKARSGVKVRILVDAYNQKAPKKGALAAYLAGVPNLEYRLFNDAPTLATENSRSHVKAFVVDGKSKDGAYIVGGRNMSDDYFGLGAKMNYVDQDLLVHGASLSVAQAQFEELWAAGARASANGDVAAFQASCLRMSARDSQVAAFLAGKAESVLASKTVRACRNVQYALDRPDFAQCAECNDPSGTEDPLLGTGLERKRMTSMFLRFVSGTRHDLQVANQYFMPFFTRPKNALEGVRDNRLKVQVFTNATGDIDDASLNTSFTCHIQSSAAAYSKGTASVAMLSSKGALNDHWELSVPGAPWRIHAKGAIRDGRDVLVSSWNIDPRSYNVNLESGVSIENCPDLASDLLVQYDKLRAITAQDASCSACKAEVIPANLKKTAFDCGGEPLFY